VTTDMLFANIIDAIGNVYCALAKLFDFDPEMVLTQGYQP